MFINKIIYLPVVQTGLKSETDRRAAAEKHSKAENRGESLQSGTKPPFKSSSIP
jgi:hypothetical protein